MQRGFLSRLICCLLAIIIIATPLGCAHVKPACQLVPEDANFLAYADINGILNDPDLRDIYESARPDKWPRSTEDALEMFRVETGLNLNDFSKAWVFADIDNLIAAGDYFGIIAEGNFNESRLINAVEKAGDIKLSKKVYKGCQMYVYEEEDWSIAICFPRSENMLLFGSRDALEDVIDVERGEKASVSGKLYDAYASLTDRALFKLAFDMSGGLMSMIKEANAIVSGLLDILGIPGAGFFSSFTHIDTISLCVLKNRSIKGQLAAYYSDEDSARKCTAMLKSLMLISKMGELLIPDISESEQAKTLLNLLNRITVDRHDTRVIIECRASVNEVKQLIEMAKEST